MPSLSRCPALFELTVTSLATHVVAFDKSDLDGQWFRWLRNQGADLDANQHIGIADMAPITFLLSAVETAVLKVDGQLRV